MYSFFLRRFSRGASVWEGLYAPTQRHRPVAAVYDRRGSFGGHRPPLQPTTAFTLLELLVVLGVIALLSGIVIGMGRRASESGRDARARAELAALSAALDSYRLAQGDYPRTNLPARLLQSLIGKRGPDYQPLTGQPLVEATRFTTGDALDPFAIESAELLDPWGHPYRYAYRSQTPWTNPSHVLWSAGQDGSDTVTLLSGGFPDAAAPGNADNLYANQP